MHHFNRTARKTESHWPHWTLHKKTNTKPIKEFTEIQNQHIFCWPYSSFEYCYVFLLHNTPWNSWPAALINKTSSILSDTHSSSPVNQVIYLCHNVICKQNMNKIAKSEHRNQLVDATSEGEHTSCIIKPSLFFCWNCYCISSCLVWYDTFSDKKNRRNIKWKIIGQIAITVVQMLCN
jgi:hypothetical protein